MRGEVLRLSFARHTAIGVHRGRTLFFHQLTEQQAVVATCLGGGFSFLSFFGLPMRLAANGPSKPPPCRGHALWR